MFIVYFSLIKWCKYFFYVREMADHSVVSLNIIVKYYYCIIVILYTNKYLNEIFWFHFWFLLHPIYQYTPNDRLISHKSHHTTNLCMTKVSLVCYWLMSLVGGVTGWHKGYAKIHGGLVKVANPSGGSKIVWEGDLSRTLTELLDV